LFKSPLLPRRLPWISKGLWLQIEPGAPAVNNVDIKGSDVEIGPFNTIGVFHIYHTLHSGRNLTIVVQ
jgi:hypothetical protein